MKGNQAVHTIREVFRSKSFRPRFQEEKDDDDLMKTKIIAKTFVNKWY